MGRPTIPEDATAAIDGSLTTAYTLVKNEEGLYHFLVEFSNVYWIRKIELTSETGELLLGHLCCPLIICSR